MSGSGREDDRGPNHGEPGTGRGGAGGSPLPAPMRSRTAGALVHLAGDLTVHRARDGTLGTGELRERFGGQLGLLRPPGLAVTALAVLVAARLLSDDHRAFRVLYSLTCLVGPARRRRLRLRRLREADGGRGHAP
ncbi:hypothetical protein OG786_10655 [Streptomyces sp. NBC_00101]|uniref:hypothetical protein n=1 Tax=Streptomyces sp. NBC_00101 TaxID=2975651 RepID=UPI00324460E4